MGDRISIQYKNGDEKAIRDIEEMVPGNKIDHIWGSDDPVLDNLEIQDHAEYLGAVVVG